MQNNEDRFPGVKRHFSDQSGDNHRYHLSLTPSARGSHGSTGVREPDTSYLPAVKMYGYSGTSYAAVDHTLYVLPAVPPVPTQGALYVTSVPADPLAQGVYTFIADWVYADDTDLFLLDAGNMEGYKIASTGIGAALSYGSTILASASTLVELLTAVSGYVGYKVGESGLTFQWYKDVPSATVTTTAIPTTVIGGKLAFQAGHSTVLTLSDVTRVSVTRVDSSLVALETLELGVDYSVLGGTLHWLTSVILETGQSLRVAYSVSAASQIEGATLGYYSPTASDHFAAVYCKVSNSYGSVYTAKFTVYEAVTITVQPAQTEFGDTLSVTATGDVLGYQWLYESVPCDPDVFGDTGNSTLPAALLGSYSVVLQSYFGNVTSATATVTSSRPRITADLVGAASLNYRDVYTNITHRDAVIPLDTWGWPVNTYLDWESAQFYGVQLSASVLVPVVPHHEGGTSLSYEWHRISSIGVDEVFTRSIDLAGSGLSTQIATVDESTMTQLTGSFFLNVVAVKRNRDTTEVMATGVEGVDYIVDYDTGIIFYPVDSVLINSGEDPEVSEVYITYDCAQSGVAATNDGVTLVTTYTPTASDFNQTITCIFTGSVGSTQTKLMHIVSPITVTVANDLATGVQIDPNPVIGEGDGVTYTWSRPGYPLEDPTVTSAVSTAPPLLTPMQLGIYALEAAGAWCNLYQEYDVTVLTEGASTIDAVAKNEHELINGPLPAGDDNGVAALAAFVGMTLTATPSLTPSAIQWWVTDGVTHTPVGTPVYNLDLDQINITGQADPEANTTYYGGAGTWGAVNGYTIVYALSQWTLYNAVSAIIGNAGTLAGIGGAYANGITFSFTPTQLESGKSIYGIAVTEFGGVASDLYDVYDLPVSQAISFGGLGHPMQYVVLRSDAGTGNVWLNNSLETVATTPTFTPSTPGYYYAVSTGPAGSIHAGPVMVTG